MGKYKLDHGIPIPEELPFGGRGVRYPWHEMEVGDSFFVPEPRNKSAAYQSARRATRDYAPKRFMARRVEGGWRIWRIA